MTRGHPTGPKLTGHGQCGAGMIYDHQSHKCISLLAAKKKKKTLVHGVS